MNNDQSELILSFVLEPEDVRPLERLALFRRLTEGRARTRTVRQVHFDTPGRRFHDQGLSLCVEHDGRKRTQRALLNLSRLGPAMERVRREGPVPTEDPAPSALDDPRILSVLSAADDGRPEPVFVVEIRRTRRVLALPAGARAMALIRVGNMVAGGARRTVRRLDLVLLDGPPAALFGLARDIVETVPLHPTAHSLEDRGSEMAAGTPPPWIKRQGLALSKKASVEQAMIAMLRAGFDHMLSNEASVLENDHPEGIHQMRVGLRRTRSALHLFRKILPPAHHDRLAGEIKWITNQLGPARDMDVFEDEIVAPVVDHAHDSEAFGVLLDRIRARRTRARANARRAVRSERYAKLLLDAGTWMAERPWRAEAETAAFDAPAIDLACSLITKRHKKVRKDGKRFDGLSIEERHQLRIDVKKLRYPIDFFGSLYPKRQVDTYLRALSGLQDSLGYLNDVAVAQDLVETICAGAKGDTLERCRYAGGMVIGWHTRTMAEIEDRLSADVKNFLATKPFWNTKTK